jgi:hypothetical protein
MKCENCCRAIRLAKATYSSGISVVGSAKPPASGFRANADDPIDQKLLRLEDLRSPPARMTRAWALFDVNDSNRQTATRQSQVEGAFGCELRQNVRIIFGLNIFIG